MASLLNPLDEVLKRLWQALTEAGSPLGLAYVGADALQHLHAAASA